MNYEFALNNKTDEEIIKIIRSGNEKAVDILIERYKSLVRSKSNKFFILGSEAKDVYQEGMIGLYMAIKNFKDDNTTTFKTFANLCIERQLITALKTANRQKHYVLNNAVSLNSAIDNDSSNSSEVINLIENETSVDPLDLLIDTEYKKNIKHSIYSKLSTKEKNVLDEFLQGKSYVEIAEKLNCKTKSIDTALTRIRKKATKIRDDMYSQNNL